jgi:hypothetical protein
MNSSDPILVAAEIERVIDSLSALPDPDAAARGRELARLLMSLYGAGLSRVLEIAQHETPGGSSVIEQLAVDPLVSSLLVLHDIHPFSPADRITRALNALQQGLPPGSTLSLVSWETDRARVQVTLPEPGRVQGETLRQAIERAVGEAAPEITSIHVDGIPLQLLQIVRPVSKAGVP